MLVKLRKSLLMASVFAMASGAQTAAQDATIARQNARPAVPAASRGFVKAFVVDDRLSALRREANLKSQVVQRLRVGRPVYIIGSSGSKGTEPPFYRVAVTRRTRGWIHAAAVAMPGRSGEDNRVLELAEGATDGFDRIALCLLLTESFKSSPLVPKALLVMASEAERAVSTLSKRANKRTATVVPGTSNASQRDYYLSDPGLDRFSKLRISFDFDEVHGQYVYDGAAYRAIIKRFPASDAAKIARERLALVTQRLAHRD